MKGVDRADQYLNYYSFLREVVKWSKNVVLYLLKCALFNAFLCTDTKYKQKSKEQELPERGRKVLEIGSPQSK